MSRAEEDVTAEDDGTTTGDFDAVDKDVNQYTLVVTNMETQEVVKKGQVSDLKNGGDKISLPLPVGKYNVKAYNYDCSNISVSTRPYFEGSANFSITNGTPTDVTLSCKLSWIEVKLNPTNAFINAFKDDYKILNREIRNFGLKIPPLVNAYMGLSPTMKVFGSGVNDEFGDVEETGILIAVNEILEEKKMRHIESFMQEYQENYMSGKKKI